MPETDFAETYADTTSSNLGRQRAFRLLRRAFIIAPIAFGLDKLSEFLRRWDHLGPWLNDIIPGAGSAQAILAVGIVEIFAGLALTALPHFFGERAQAFIDPLVGLASDALSRLLS